MGKDLTKGSGGDCVAIGARVSSRGNGTAEALKNGRAVAAEDSEPGRVRSYGMRNASSQIREGPVGQGLANSGPWPAFISKVLLGHSHACSCAVCGWRCAARAVSG